MGQALVLRPIWQLIDSSTIGGIESHVATLSEALIKKGRATEIVLLADHGANPWLAQLGDRHLPFSLLDGRFSSLLKRLRADRPSVVHTHGYKAGIMGRLACRLAGIPVVSTFHAGDRGAFPVSLYQDIDRWTSILSTRVAVNDAIAATIPFATHVIRNFIAIEPPGDIAGKPMSVAFVGRLSPEKGPDLFCEIAVQSEAGIAFDVYGDGPMRQDLEKRYGNRIRFHGLQRNMWEVWPRIGLLLMPSRAEGLPMAALEAMAAGVPVAASRVGGLPDLIDPDRTGWLFQPEAVGEACRIIASCVALSYDQRAAMSEMCREAAANRFGPDQPVAQLLQIYAQASSLPRMVVENH